MQVPPPSGSGRQKPPTQMSPLPQAASSMQPGSQAPSRQRAPGRHSLLNRQVGGAGGPAVQTPFVQHAPGSQSPFE
jgi:hypothetical protein